ncbi:MAG: NAD(P)-binding domain-containing protein [Anaerolineales bacterium]|nr:NAD(P)-binding domain-containing protein [Anaerolineales bacterium]
MKTKPTLGYIGLGLMGKPMVNNLLKAGYSVVIHNRSREVVKTLVAEGAEEAFSPQEVASRVDIIFTNLPDSPDVELVALGENGILDGARQGLIYVDHSTIKPSLARNIDKQFRAKGAFSLDAPVSGGDIGAQNGTLAIMVGGPAEALEQVKPIFEVVGKSITHVGEAGSGQIAKAANQIMVAAQMVALAELLILAKKSGADPARVVQAIKGGAAQCWALDVKPDRLFSGNRQPGFKAYMQEKDLNIVVDTAREYGAPVPAASLHTQLFGAMLQMGMADLDNSAIIGVIENLASTTLLD